MSAERPSSRGWWWGIAIAAFVCVDIVLIVFALGAAKEAPESSQTYLPPQPLFSTTPNPSASAAPVEEATVHAFLSAADSTVAWRATSGACSGTPVPVQQSVDGGDSWSDTTPPLGSVLALSATDSQTVTVVGGSTVDCSLQTASTNDAGSNWTVSAVTDSWYLPAIESFAVQGPSGSIGTPCAVSALAALSDTDAAVLCREQIVYRTTDAGASWDGGLAIPGADAIDNTGAGYIVAATEQAACSGVEVRSLDSAAEAGDGTYVGCLPNSIGSADVAIAHAPDGAVWVWAGDDVVVSVDGGATWP